MISAARRSSIASRRYLSAVVCGSGFSGRASDPEADIVCRKLFLRPRFYPESLGHVHSLVRRKLTGVEPAEILAERRP